MQKNKTNTNKQKQLLQTDKQEKQKNGQILWKGK